MAAEPIIRAKEVRDDGSVVEIVVWRIPQPLPPCTHPYKYRLYFGAGGVQLLEDFQRDVENWR